MKSPAEKLADLIEKHPDAIFEIDNDGWYMAGQDGNDLAEKIPEWDTNWYSHSSNYGAGIAEALVILLNRRGFKITASAV